MIFIKCRALRSSLIAAALVSLVAVGVAEADPREDFLAGRVHLRDFIHPEDLAGLMTGAHIIP